VYSNALSGEYASRVNGLLAAGRRVVLLDQYVPGCEAPVAMVDKHKVGYLATEHLIMTGHRRIAYVSTHTFDTSGNDSYRGYRQALDDYGVRFDDRLEINIPVESSAGPASDAIRALLRSDSTMCTAIATPQFAMAYGIYRVLLELNLVPGRDIALVGNNMAYNPEYAHITHTSQSFQEVGVAAMQIFCRDEKDVSRLQKHILVPPRLVVGTT
jgi:DNA-binding LacI/PurR family transcriptional regulator